jgi:hypothetical protein
MSLFKKALFGSLAIVALSVVVALSGIGQALADQIPNPLSVLVINTTTNPVPVSGSINVGNAATSPIPVRDVDDPARHAFYGELCASQPATCSSSLTIPAGQRLVIEFVSGDCAGGNSVTDFFPLLIVHAGTAGNVAFPFRPMPAGGSSPTHFVFDEQTRIYADTNLQAAVFSTGNISCDLRFSGYLVSL